MIYIIIPNYNGLNHLKTCFDSLRIQSYKEFKTVLVDNASSDESITFTKDNYPEVNIISLDKNYGFSKTVNSGIEFALKDENSKYVILLNNDTECKEDLIEQLLSGFKDDNTGSVACKMLSYYDHNIIDNAGLYMDIKDLPFLRGHYEKDKGQYDKSEFIFGACAGAGMYKKEVFEKLGLFDEDFFAYHEDMDFNIRMQLYGYKCYYNPNAVCYHKGSATSGNKSNFKIYLCEKNIYLLRIKNYPLKILMSNSIFFLYYGAKRFYRYFIDGSVSNVWAGIKGFFKGISQTKKILIKRKKLSRFQKVSFYDVKFMP